LSANERSRDDHRSGRGRKEQVNVSKLHLHVDVGESESEKLCERSSKVKVPYLGWSLRQIEERLRAL
jgi:hypothetical protein